MWNKEETLALKDVLLVCHTPSIFGLARLEEYSTPTQMLGMDPATMVHIEMADAEVVEDAVVDLNNPVPHSKICKRIEGTMNRM